MDVSLSGQMPLPDQAPAGPGGEVKPQLPGHGS
jgi:hypothetical protein